MELTQEKLKEVISYDPETGEFTWIKCGWQNGYLSGKPAGGITEAGYLRIRIGRKKYMAHRLAWLYMTGEMPSVFLDHKNRNRGDNRWCNLREASHSENAVNRPTSTKFGMRGAYQASSNRWVAMITINRKCITIGAFATQIEAHEAYMKAAKEAFGEFATK